jgi:hypothetical protein
MNGGLSSGWQQKDYHVGPSEEAQPSGERTGVTKIGFPHSLRLSASRSARYTHSHIVLSSSLHTVWDHLLRDIEEDVPEPLQPHPPIG